MNNSTGAFYHRLLPFLFYMLAAFSSQDALAQEKSPYVRVASIVVDSARLDSFRAAIKEGIETAVRTEPGVLSLYAVYDKNNPAHVTVFEIYASEQAYRLHIQTAHFTRYKAAVQDMVKSLVLTDVIPIALEAKSNR